jgi:chitin synthase
VYFIFLVPEKHLASTQSTELIIAWRWAIIIAFSIPELGTWIKSIRLCFFKKIRNSEWKEFIMVFITESFYVIGLVLLAFVVLPELDSIQGIMITNLFCFIPSILCE